MRNILLVGGGGYIGAVVAQYLIENGDTVTVLDNLIYGQNIGVSHLFSHPNYNFAYGDIQNDSLIENLLNDVTDVVLLAGLVGDPITKKYPEASKKINLDGVRSFLDRCTNSPVKRLIFVSTCSNYGLMADGKIANEDSELNPLSLYAEHKVANEEYLLENTDEFSFTSTVLRFSTAFGWSPRMRFDLTVNEFAYEACTGKPFEVYDADTWRPYCHVDDFALAIDLILSSNPDKVNGEVFNVGSDQNNFTKRGLVELIGSKVNQMDFSFNTHGSDPRNYRVDFSKIKSKLGFETSKTVESGIDQVISAYKQRLLNDVASNRTNYGNYNIIHRN